ncbi:unnamed protein product [Scytosiphon promiscuus]
MLHVVLFRPLIPANTGNIGRTCLGFGARLHLVKPLGFDLGEREVKRAGLDHWDHVDLAVHDSWRCFTESILPQLGHGKSDGVSDASEGCKTSKNNDSSNIYLVSKRLKLGSTPIADVNFFKPQPPAGSPPPPPRIAAISGPHVEEGASRRMSAAKSGGAVDHARKDVFLVFGNEVDGLSGLEEGARGRALPAVFLPMRDDVIRSYNLSNAVAMAVYEVDRQRRESRPIEEAALPMAVSATPP